MANALEQSANSVKEQVKSGHLDGAVKEVTKVLLDIEASQADPHAKAVKEAEFFNDLLKQNSELKKMGFPELQIIETGVKIQSNVDGYYSNLAWTSFSKEHPSKGGHKITGTDVQAVDPELITSSNGKFNMGAKRDEVQTGTGTDDPQVKKPFNLGDQRDTFVHPESNYPLPKMVEKPTFWDGSGTVQFEGRNVPVEFSNISDSNAANLRYVGLVSQGGGRLSEVSGLLQKNENSGSIVITKCVVDGKIIDAPPGWVIPMQKHER